MIRPSRVDTVRLLTERAQALYESGDNDAADLVWQCALRIRNLNRETAPVTLPAWLRKSRRAAP